MIAILGRDCTLAEKTDVVRRLEWEGYSVTVERPRRRDDRRRRSAAARPGLEERLAGDARVRETRHDVPPYALVSRTHHPETTRVRACGVTIGGDEVVVDRGALLGRIRGTDPLDRARVAPLRGAHAAWRRVLAADLAVRLPGLGRGGACGCLRPRRSETGPPGGPPKSIGPEDVELLRALRRRAAGRRAQHAELPPAGRVRPAAQAGVS